MSSSHDPGLGQALLYDTYFTCFRKTLITSMVEILLYGAYAVAFGLYVYLESRHQKRGGGRVRFYQISLSVLFLLSTVALGLSISNLRPRALICFAKASSNSILIQDEPLALSQRLRIAVQSVYVAANAIADTLMLCRCYDILISSKWVIAGPSLLCATNTGMAITAIVFQYRKIVAVSAANTSLSNAGKILFEVFMGTNFFSNLLLTGLIAGRIWWMTRDGRKKLGLDEKRGDQSMTSIILGSGLLYPIALVPCTAFELHESQGRFFLEPLLVVIVGLAPTLMMVMVHGVEQSGFAEGQSLVMDSHSSSQHLDTPPNVSMLQAERAREGEINHLCESEIPGWHNQPPGR
ncbi:hypothetical protein D9757_004977 [Collybiopsis confluens]|uniref:Uncharacterized protein n=1 Tax=Collybiopsis confluens TaxID=2823264 RepID=A0A8H5HTV7_9AGAR|nr:hypothetical protein D9757_004977 [Collybiopsis confluens]